MAVAQTHRDLFQVVPETAAGVLVVNDLAKMCSKVEAICKRFHLPLADPLKALKSQLGVEKGLAENGAIAVIWLPAETEGGVSRFQHFALAIPITDFPAFAGQLGVKDFKDPIQVVSIANTSACIGHKGSFAIFTNADDRDTLAKFLGSNASADKLIQAQSDWIAENDVSVVFPPQGTQFALSSLMKGIEQVEQQIAASGVPNAEMVKSSLGIYQKLFHSMAQEVTQMGIGLRIDTDRAIQLQKRLLLKADGNWATANATLAGRSAPSLQGLPNGPFAFAFAGILGSDWSAEMMKWSVDMWKTMPTAKDLKPLTPEQAQRVAAVSGSLMQGVESMSMVMGIPAENMGLYGSTIGILTMKSTDGFLDRYGKAIEELKRETQGTQAGIFGMNELERIQLDGRDVLKLTVDSAASLQALDKNLYNEKQLQAMFGPNGKVTMYLTAINPKTVIMAYTSEENLQRGLQAVQGKQTSFVSQEQIKQTTELMPEGAQMVGYLSLSGIMEFAKKTLAFTNPGVPVPIPTLPSAPPLGMTVNLTPQFVQGSLIVPLATIEATANGAR